MNFVEGLNAGAGLVSAADVGVSGKRTNEDSDFLQFFATGVSLEKDVGQNLHRHAFVDLVCLLSEGFSSQITARFGDLSLPVLEAVSKKDESQDTN